MNTAHPSKPRPRFAARCAARLKRPPRLSGWFLIALLLAVLVWAIAPQQLPVSLYKLSLVTLAGVVGYWLDRSMFPYARPDEFLPDTTRVHDVPGTDEPMCTMLVAPEDAQLKLAGMAMQRRALIVAATMLAMGLGA